jgi:hypothetical protein
VISHASPTSGDLRLGPIEERTETISEESEAGISITLTAARGERRDGYEMLRDVITRHRRAEKYLTAYLDARWKADVQSAGEAYHRHTADRARPPTVKQFAEMAGPARTNWFAGDLAAVYNVLGLRSPLPPTTYRRCIPENASGFTKRLRQVLRAVSSTDASTKDTVRFTNSTQVLAQHSLTWLGQMEVLGKPPELAQFIKRDYFKQAYRTGSGWPSCSESTRPS